MMIRVGEGKLPTKGPPEFKYEKVNGPWEPSRVENKNGGGWTQSNRPVKVKPQYRWVWPKDGKRRSMWGRWKDIMTGRGPDVHVAISGESRNRQKDWPSKARWSRWKELADPEEEDRGSLEAAPWAKRGVDEKYDFRTRKYGRPTAKTWTDVKWQNPPSEHFASPRAKRDIHGQWFELHRRSSHPNDW